MSWQYYIAILAKVLLVSYFFRAGVINLLQFRKMVNVVKNKRIPLPTLSLVLVIIIEILGSIAIVVNIYAYVAALLLAVFTILVNFYFCSYWKFQGLERRNASFVFYANIAVLGGLLLVVAFSPI